jgi:hypothetical protein
MGVPEEHPFAPSYRVWSSGNPRIIFDTWNLFGYETSGIVTIQSKTDKTARPESSTGHSAGFIQ